MIFKEHAPHYWAANLPAMPLRRGEKKPILEKWQEFCSEMPSADQRTSWLNAYSQNNIGLPLGPASGLYAIDIDAWDAELAAEIEMALPRSSWRRVGAKGCVLVFRYSGQANFAIKDHEDKMLVEGLGLGRQIVLPPSIHPDTKSPYTSNCDLWDVDTLRRVPELPNPERFIRDLLGDRARGRRMRTPTPPQGRKLAEGDGRHNDLVRVAGLFRNNGLTGAELRAALITYSTGRFETMLPDHELDGIVRAATEDWDGGDGLPLTELGNAKRLVAALNGDARYAPELKSWYMWDGSRWSVDTHGKISRQAKAVAEALFDGANGNKERRAAGAKAQTRNGIANMIALAQTEPDVSVDVTAFDRDIDVLNTPSGVVDLQTGLVLPPQRDALHSKVAGAPFDPAATAPAFDKFLCDIFPDEQIRAFAQRWVGYCLTGRTDAQKFLIASGAGANGKSTLLNIIARAMGDYAKHTAMATFMQRKSDAASNDLAALNGARMVLAVESNRGQPLDTAMIKSVTGGDPVTARFLHKEFVTFTPRFKPVLVSNHLPEIDGDDPAIWRRLIVLPFNRIFKESEQDAGLTTKLEKELAGILRWAVEGAVAYYREGLTPPDAVVAEASAFRAEMDLIGSFVEECCVTDSQAETPFSQLYPVFERFAREVGITVPTQKVFASELGRRGFKLRKSGSNRYRQGLAIKPLSIAV